MLVLRPQRAGELVMAVRLGVFALLLERPAECVVRVVVGRRELEHDAELLLGLLVTLDAQVRDAERFADRRLAWLTTLRLLERNSRLGRPPLAQMGPPLLEKIVGLAHRSRR